MRSQSESYKNEIPSTRTNTPPDKKLSYLFGEGLASPKGSDYGETTRILVQLMGGGMSFDSSFISINGESKAETDLRC